MSTTIFQKKLGKSLKNESNTQYNERGLELLNKFNKKAESNQISNMTLDDINSEIVNCRSDKINKCKNSHRKNEDLNKFVRIEKSDYNKQIIDEYLSEGRKDRTF